MERYFTADGIEVPAADVRRDAQGRPFGPDQVPLTTWRAPGKRERVAVKRERVARSGQPQLIVVLADTSLSMAGPRIKAAVDGIREMILDCQTRGPRGPGKSYFKVLLIRFDETASVIPGYEMVPVRDIDPDALQLEAKGRATNFQAALNLAERHLRDYLALLADHPDIETFPVPLVLLFSDGDSNRGDPLAAAGSLKKLRMGSDPVVLLCAGITEGGSSVNEDLLRKTASLPECYQRISDLETLKEWLVKVGSSGKSSAADLAALIRGTTAVEI